MFHCEFCKKFWLAFMPGFIGTGTGLGITYVLITKTISADRARIEGFFEGWRQKFDSGHVPILEWSQPLMIAALYGIYGRNVARRILVSAGISTFFTCLIFGSVYWRYRSVSPSIHIRKTQLEVEADPKLYRYFTDPKLRPEYDKAQQMESVPAGQDNVWMYVYHGAEVGPNLGSKSMFVSVAPSNWGLGICTKLICGIRTRRPSASKKKNRLSFLIGPPRDPAH